MKYTHLILSTLLIAISSTAIAAEKATEARQDEVARKGRHVMPFDLEQTLHVFTNKKDGGRQKVVAKDAHNKVQIKLIREHLTKIAADFKRRDFSDPIKIHGENMPGLKALIKAKPESITIQYRQLADGAEITYSSEEADLIDAIQQWFKAQLSDHARHAVMHRSHHPTHIK
jgi:hypothetical protein